MKIDREKEYYIINNKISIFYQMRDLLLTFMLWGLWFYIFYPLIALVIWNFFDTNIFYNYSLKEIEVLNNSLYLFLFSSGIIIFLLVSSFIGWGYYNKKKFSYRGNKRRYRKRQQPITSEMMAKSLNVSFDAIEISKQARYVQIYHTSKTPKSKENIFKPIDDLNVKSANLYFSDDWDAIRETSNFGFTHIIKEEKKRNFEFKKISSNAITKSLN